MVPFPAGRFLIDLPAGACVRFGRQGFNEAGTFAARYSDEHIELLVGFPSMPGVTLRVRTDTVGEVVAGYPPLLAREARRPRGVQVRAGERPVWPFPGQELVKQAGPRDWLFTWENLGRPREPLAPMLLLEMRAGGGEALGLWDAVLRSLRRRENFSRSLRLPVAFRSSLTT
jgi:hypothetical protein